MRTFVVIAAVFNLVWGVWFGMLGLAVIAVASIGPTDSGSITFFLCFFPGSLTLPLFHCVVGLKALAGWRRFDVNSTRWVQRTETGWRVRLEPSVRWLVALTGLIILGACVLVVGLLSLGSPIAPPRWEVAVVMWLVGLVPLLILCWRTPPNRWLEVDEQARELRWVHCRTGEHFVIPFSQVAGIRVVNASQMFLFGRMSCRVVNIRWFDGDWPQTTQLSRWLESPFTLNPQAAESAFSVNHWLRERLGVGNGVPRKARLLVAEE